MIACRRILNIGRVWQDDSQPSERRIVSCLSEWHRVGVSSLRETALPPDAEIDFRHGSPHFIAFFSRVQTDARFTGSLSVSFG